MKRKIGLEDWNLEIGGDHEIFYLINKPLNKAAVAALPRSSIMVVMVLKQKRQLQEKVKNGKSKV